MEPHTLPDVRKVYLAVTFLALVAMLIPGMFPRVAFAQGAAGRVYVVSHVDVLPKFGGDAAKLLSEFVTDSRRDAGVVRFEAQKETAGGNHFTLIEIWESPAAREAHMAAAHTKAFREKLFGWLGSPYDERLGEEVK